MPFAHKTDDVIIIMSTIVALQFLVLVALTPILIKRFHDLNSSGYWILLFWIGFSISLEPAILIKELYGIFINPFSMFSLFIHLIILLALAVLVFKKGNPDHNAWGSPNNKFNMDFGADAPPPVN